VPLFSRASGFGPLFDIVGAEQGAESLERLCRESRFVAADFSPSTLVPFAVMNGVYNLAAKLTGDRQFGARVGQAIRLEDFGPFVDYALHGATLGELIARTIVAQPLHSGESFTDLRVVGGQACWRLRYRANAEPTVEHHAQRTLMQMLSAVSRYAGVRRGEIEIHVAEPYAAEARLLEGRLDVKVRPRANDYELAFPAQWLDNWTPIGGLPPALPIEALAPYRDRPLPSRTAEAVLVALGLHDDLPRAGIVATAAEIGMLPRTLQLALRSEGVTFREIARALRMRRARQLLATTAKPLAEVALRTGYTDPSNFHRAFVAQTGLTPGRFREELRAPVRSLSEHC